MKPFWGIFAQQAVQMREEKRKEANRHEEKNLSNTEQNKKINIGELRYE